MSILAPEHAFAPKERSFTVSCMEDSPITGYVELSSTPDFSTTIAGNASYGFIPSDAATSKYHYNHFVPVDPQIGGPGDIIYWRIKNKTTGQNRSAKSIRLKRPRNHQTEWNFIVGGSAADLSGSTTGLSLDCKQFCIPTALSLNPDFICIPGDIINASAAPADLNTALAQFQQVRQDLSSCGVDIPIYHSPGDEDQEGSSSNRTARGRLLPSSGSVIRLAESIRGPQTDPFTENGNNFNSYYAFAYGNALFVFFNDWLGGSFVTDINVADYAAQKMFIEAVLKEHRHKYKWCFTFSHTSVDQADPTNTGGSVDTIAESTSTQAWLMGLHSEYKVSAHFSAHYHGWRVHKHTNGTTYVNSVFGAGTAAVSSGDWHKFLAFANVRIGVDQYGNLDPDGCKIDIVNPGVTGTAGEILNISSENNGIIRFQASNVINHKNENISIFNSVERQTVIALGSNWHYNAESSLTNPVDFLITRRFMDVDFKPAMWDDSLSSDEKLSAWKISPSPFWGGPVADALDTASGFTSANTNTGVTSGFLQLPLSWQSGTELSISPAANTPIYLLKKFDIPEYINVEELQLIYQIQDAAYVWINGHLAWYSDGEGSPGSVSPFTHTFRPELNPNKVNPASSEFASNVLSDLEPIPNTQDGAINSADSHSRAPEIHYELQGQPIRIINLDVINSLKKTGNTIAVMLLQGRDFGFSNPTPCESFDLSFDLELNVFGSKNKNLYSPHIITPSKSQHYNRGFVEITWDINIPPAQNLDTDATIDDPYFEASVFDSSSITYEIEYTDNYVGKYTNWFSVKKRIPYGDSSYDWKVGKMIKSNSVRLRLRAKDTSTEEVSDWSISDQFSINVFDLIAPAIVSPIPNYLYSDFIMIIMDETLTKNTYHQKIRYTLEYSSRKQNISWTVIRQNLPFGQNIIRWNLGSLPPSDDYSLRLMAKNFSTSCKEPDISEPDQIARTYIHNIKIQQSGLFLIDTKAPEAIIKIESNNRVTNQLEQIVNIFAQDLTTQVETIQMRECDASSVLSLGDIEDPYDPNGGCSSIEELLEDNPDFNNLLGKSVSATTKLQWVFDNRSGLRKLEAMLTDSGGNISLQESIRVFLDAYTSDEEITDFVVVVEQRDQVTINPDTNPPSLIIEPSIFEVIYLSTISGKMFILEPFARLLYTIESSPKITKLVEFNESIYICTYIDGTGKIYRHDISQPTLLKVFSGALSEVLGAAVYDGDLYFGLRNGELWIYTGFVFSRINTFEDNIQTLHSDREYLYIGFQNSSSIVLYNGSSFTILDVS